MTLWTMRMMLAWWTALPATHRRSSGGGVWAGVVEVLWAPALEVVDEGGSGLALKANGE